MKKALAVFDPESRALALTILWLLLVHVLVVLAWQAGWLTRQGALVHWLALGVLPPALALWSFAPGVPPRR